MQANKTVQRLPWSVGVPDSHGNTTTIWGDPVDVKVYGWAPPSPDVENTAGRSQTIRDLDLLAPTGTTAEPDDVFIIAGETYQVVGHPESFADGPFGYQAGVRINLNRSEG